jgi:hypothetical protein
MSTAKHHPDANGRYFCNKQLHIHRICAQSIKANKTMRIVSLLRMNDIIGLENGMESCGNHKIVIDRYLISFSLIQENWMISQIISRVKYANSILVMIFVSALRDILISWGYV